MSKEPDDPQRIQITPEQRRVLGPARSRKDWPSGQPESVKSDSTVSQARAEMENAATRPAPRKSRQSGVRQIQNLVVCLAAAFFLVAAFYVGKKFDYWKYRLISYTKPAAVAGPAEKFAAVSVEDLIEQAIVDERLGNWKDAAERFIAAKYKNLIYPGLLFRAAKLYYDHSDFDNADLLLERAVAFGEDVDRANYYRGMIAAGRRDYAAAERFYEAAASAAPFNADYFYSWAETLRRSHRLQDAIAHYRQAALRAEESEENICRFKVRMTMLEGGDVAAISAELEKQKSAGPLSVDWLMTDAALQIKAGQPEEAVRLVKQAREADRSLFQGHFAACASDKFFSEAANSYPALAEACRMQTSSTPPAQP